MGFDVLLSKDQLEKRVKELGNQISKDYSGEEVTIVGVLNGSFIFCSDLVRSLELPVNIEFISVSSYVGTQSSGTLNINLDLKENIEGKNVILVEDIVDTGNTISKLCSMFEKRNPKSLKVASLLFKPARLENKVNIDYLAFEIEDHFVIGYGLDFNGKYRELPYVGIYSND